MNRVKLLAKETSELIAAGEVIERPASLIKELVENSIDSGASNITVEIKDGGVSFIRVTDNGSGIYESDVPTAFLRHATSKITEKSDLDNIMTLGFRGEALASICAVAKVEMLTKTADEELGTHYIIEASNEILYEKSGCPDGTTIIIRDIFYNVPARLKFLKKNVSEGNAIADIYSKIALSHPEISFKFIRNNKQEFFTSGNGDLYSAIYSVLGKDFASELIPVDYELNGIKIHGFTVKPIYGKSRRTFQYFFVNGRYVKAYTCNSALQEAYENMIMVGKFPACVLMLEAPASIIDVNVHPAKIEVRFTDERVIHDSVYFSVKNAILAASKPEQIKIKAPVTDYKAPLAESFNIGVQTKMENQVSAPVVAPTAPITTTIVDEVVDENTVFPDDFAETPTLRNTFKNNVYKAFQPEENNLEEVFLDNLLPTDLPYNSYIDDTDLKFINSQSFVKKEDSITSKCTETPAEVKEEIYFRVVGEAFKKYIVAQTETEVLFVDKHAAHERILFEKLRKGEQELSCQLLLEAAEIKLPYSSYDALASNYENIGELGFELKLKGNSYVEVIGVPDILADFDVADLVCELADNFLQNKNNPLSEILDEIYHTVACKAAIKTNDNNSLAELEVLVKTVLEDKNIRYCPHGRPTVFSLSKYELDKQFGRT